MFKKLEPKADRVKQCISQFPHCDQRVLHSPGECEYCDRHPEWQALRIAWGIAFTGYTPEGHELPDPASQVRDIELIELWPGNRAKQPAQEDNATAY